MPGVVSASVFSAVQRRRNLLSVGPSMPLTDVSHSEERYRSLLFFVDYVTRISHRIRRVGRPRMLRLITQASRSLPRQAVCSAYFCKRLQLALTVASETVPNGTIEMLTSSLVVECSARRCQAVCGILRA
jgi:hypothetical protein